MADAGVRQARRVTSFAPVKNGLAMAAGKAARILLIQPHQAFVKMLGSGSEEWVPIAEVGPFVKESASEKAEVVEAEGEALDRAEAWCKAFQSEPISRETLPGRKKEIASEMGVTVRTVERHLARYLEDPTPRGLLRSRPGPLPGSNRQTAAQNELLRTGIRAHYATKQKKSISEAYNAIKLEFAEAGESPPSYATFRRRVMELDRIKLTRERHGRVFAKATVEPAGPSTKARRTLEFVQMDHAIADVIVVDSKRREPITRPWLTLAIDVASRTVLGFYYSLSDPDQSNVGLSLAECCFPHSEWLLEHGYEDEWIPYGIMQTIGWDNAKYYRAKGIVKACRSYGIEPRFRRVRTPTHGAHIERFIGTMMGKLHLLPGTTFSNPKQRGDYKSEKTACMTLPDLIKWTAEQINGVYHNTNHAGLKLECGEDKTPLQRWKELRTTDEGYVAPAVPTDRRAFVCAMMPGEHRKVGREGIKRFGTKFWDSSLIPHIGEQVWVAHDPRDISKVFIRAGSNWLDVPNRDRTVPACTLDELNYRKRQGRSSNGDTASTEAVLHSLRKSREIEEGATKATKTVRRMQEQRPKDSVKVRASDLIDYSKKPPLLVEDPF
jgi:putative transposase